MSAEPLVDMAYFLWSHEKQAYVETARSKMSYGSFHKNVHVDILDVDENGVVCVKAHDTQGESVPPHMK